MAEEGSDPPKRVMIIAPVGAYFGRVKKGIEWALGLGVPSSTEYRVILVVPETWMREEEYAKAIEKLKGDFSDNPQLREQCKGLTAGLEKINMEHETSCTVLLLNTLISFLHNRKDSAAFVDMTSAPKEWIFACHYVAEFFEKDNVAFYHVKPSNIKMPKDFKDPKEIQDPGLIPEKVILSGPDVTLKEWITEGTMNWKFFRTICEKIMATKQPGKSILKTSILLKDLAKESSKWMQPPRRPRKLGDTADSKTRPKGHSDETEGLRSAGMRLSQVRKFGLFEETLHTIRLTNRGYALGKSLFHLPEETAGKES
jgi:hypothetical protein